MFSAVKLLARLRWLRRSSALRLTVLLSALFAVAMTISVSVTLLLGHRAVLERVDVTLNGLAYSVAADDAPEDSFSVIIQPIRDLEELPREFAKAARRGGGTINLKHKFRRAEEWRTLVSEDADGTPVLIAIPIDDSEEALELLGGILWTTTIVVVVLALVIGLIAGLFAQRRIERINSTLNYLAAGDLQARTGMPASNDDLGDLARQLDSTASELERLIAQTRHLSASIAHDLRTPLARLRARLEKLPASEERSDALEEAERLSGIFDTMMRIARIEAQQGTKGFGSVDLGTLVSELGETYGPVVEDCAKKLTINQKAASSVNADRQMLVQAIANLLQNALVHGGSEITLFAEGATLGVADNGPGVDPAQYAEIIRPMVRLDTARSGEGSGLGLALVRAVADRHGAELLLSQEQPQGLRVTFKFEKL